MRDAHNKVNTAKERRLHTVSSIKMLRVSNFIPQQVSTDIDTAIDPSAPYHTPPGCANGFPMLKASYVTKPRLLAGKTAESGIVNGQLSKHPHNSRHFSMLQSEEDSNGVFWRHHFWKGQVCPCRFVEA